MCHNLNFGLSRVISMLSLAIITGSCLLIINDCIDQAPDNFNYEKYRLKCLVGTAIVMFTTIFIYSAYNKLNDEFD